MLGKYIFEGIILYIKNSISNRGGSLEGGGWGYRSKLAFSWWIVYTRVD